MGTGGITHPTPSKPVEKIVDKFKSTLNEAKEAEQYELKSRMKKIRNESEKIMDDAKDTVDPNINDHGPRHIERVLDKTEKVEEAFDQVSLTKKQIGRLQDEREKFELRSATSMHDTGRTKDLNEPHSVQSSKIIDARKDLFTDIRERERIAKLALLHNKEGSRTLGSDKISELAEKGLLNKKEALQASILRISDALDIGKERVETNTQGEPAHQVIDRIQRSSDEKARSYLTHWYGHRGIISAEPYNDNGKFGVRIRLDPEYLRSNGTDVAFVANDLLSDVGSTIVNKNYSIDFKCSDKNLARAWYQRNFGMLAEEAKGVHIEFTQAYDANA